MNAPRLSPNVTEEMRSPHFWVKKLKGDPDQVIMTPAQISELNMRNWKKTYEFTDDDGKKNSIVLNICDPLTMKSISGTISGASSTGGGPRWRIKSSLTSGIKSTIPP